MLKKFLGISLLLASSYALAGTESSYLFLQTASEGELVKNKDKSYTLTLKNITKHVNYFTDRPERKAGIMTLKQFLELWKNEQKGNFSEVPPNVAIAMKPVMGQSQSFVAVASKPAYANNTLSYQLNIISKTPLNPGKLAYINMFFDDIPWGGGGFG